MVKRQCEFRRKGGNKVPMVVSTARFEFETAGGAGKKGREEGNGFVRGQKD